MAQLIQVAGSLLILVAFAGAQRGTLATDSPRYLWLNLVGAVVLTVLAAIEAQLGFLLLETCWAIVTAWSLVRLYRGGVQPAA